MITRGASPLGLPYTLPRFDLRAPSDADVRSGRRSGRVASLAALARVYSLRGFAPRTPLHAPLLRPPMRDNPETDASQDGNRLRGPGAVRARGRRGARA